MFKVVDIFLFILAVGVIGFSIYAAYFLPRGQTQVVIQGQSGRWIYHLDARETVIVSGPIGNTVVRIDGSRAWVESSPCENQTCVSTGSVLRQGQWAACLPNNVLLMIDRTGSEDVDAISR